MILKKMSKDKASQDVPNSIRSEGTNDEQRIVVNGTLTSEECYFTAWINFEQGQVCFFDRILSYNIETLERL